VRAAAARQTAYKKGVGAGKKVERYQRPFLQEKTKGLREDKEVSTGLLAAIQPRESPRISNERVRTAAMKKF